MNYGYALLSSDGKYINKLKKEDEFERFPLQMYHYIATGLGNFKDLKEKTVLDIGCGRGGGLEYIVNYLGCK